MPRRRSARPLPEATWGTRIAAGAQILGILWRADPLRSALAAVLLIVASVAAPLTTLLLGRLIDDVSRRDVNGAVASAIWIGALALASGFAVTSSFRLRMRMREVGGHALSLHSAETVGAIPGIEHLERPDVADRVEQLRSSQTELAGLLDAVIMNVARIISAIVTVGVLASVSPWFALLILFGAPTVWASSRTSKAALDLNERLTPDARRMWQLRHVLETPEASGEVRVFGLAKELGARHQQLFDSSDRQQRTLALRNQALTSGAWLLFAAGYLGALAMVLARAVAGDATVGEVAIITTLGGQVRGVLQSLSEMATWMVGILRTSDRFAWVQDVARTAAAAAAEQSTEATVPERLQHGIDLVGLSFRYPGTEVDVLRDVTVHLPAGATVAIVGDNGAGKSTLVKLLARFYEPTSGTILVDGVPLRSLPLEQWRSRLSAGFQDFARLQVLARESVGVGQHQALAQDDPDSAVLGALGRACADELLADLPRGLDTQLGTWFDDGVELSGGQWQKVALGRSMMRQRPLLLLLDEPTAALDARAEHELFERYAGAADGAAATVGGITLLVSHRFSTVREADLILVVDGSTVAAAGTHQELMAQQGLYAELYELQARAYR